MINGETWIYEYVQIIIINVDVELCSGEIN